MNNPIDIAAIRKQVDLYDFTQRYLEPPEANKIHCPYHEDSTPSLHLYGDGKWHCFSCNRSGDVIDMAGILYFGRQYDPSRHLLEVVERLAGLGISTEPRPRERQTRERSGDDKSLEVTLSDCDRWHHTMPETRRAYWWGRGLSDTTINAFRLGWDGRRYTIPVSYRGLLIGVKRRKADDIDDGINAKYAMAKGSKATLFNADSLLREFGADEPVFVTEGEIDAMLLSQQGYAAVSSTAGASTWHPEWAAHFSYCPRIIVLYDNDEPGRQGALRVMETLRRAELWYWPENYKDGGEFLPMPASSGWIQNHLQD